MTAGAAPSADPTQIRPRFLPWLRTGLAGRLTEPAVKGLAGADFATLTVEVTLKSSGSGGQVVDDVPSPPIRLRAPGEITGIDPSLVVRRDPAPGTQDAEGNYFALIEFTAPDLPWRYTPAKAARERLQPWIALVVVEERDGVHLDVPGGGRLPVLTVDDADRELPDLAQCWAWAHVQAVHELAGGVAAALAADPSAFRSRLLCPRRLTADRRWLACVVPTFNSGRRAGLGQPAGIGADPVLAWDAAGGEVVLPVYYSWRFRTGEQGDFESLVRRLAPRELGPEVGQRDLDLSAPGGWLPEVPGTVTSYLGALISPAAQPREWPVAHRAATKQALRRTLNRALSASATPDRYEALDDDPVVGPVAYGAAQAHRSRVPAEGEPPVWFEQLATEPPHRVVAGLGTEVVRRDQEVLMAVAWADAAPLREVNGALAGARLAWEAARLAAPGIAALPDESLVQIVGPAMVRLAHPGGLTVRGAVAASALPAGLISGAFRRITRTTRGFAMTTSAGSKTALTRAVTSLALAEPVEFVRAWGDVLPPAGADIQRAGTTTTLPTASMAGRATAERTAAPGGIAARRPPAAGLAAMPHDHVLELPTRPLDQVVVYDGDSAIVADLVADVRRVFDPSGAIVRMVEARVAGLGANRSEAVPAALPARPVFTTPMYQRLVALSADYLVPGIGDVPDDTLGLLQVNHAYVEAFLTGLNTELGREYRWREYPANLGATWFRQFWDAGAADAPDIVPMKFWSPAHALGEHGPPETARAELVLLIKGALPRRYPDLRIYAVEAQWQDGARREHPDGAVLLPVFAGLLGDSAFFYGFNLTEDAARGSTRPPAHPGYFIVIEQQPFAPRFGLDVAQDRFRGVAPRRWSDLSWSHLVAEGDPLPDFVDVTGPQWLVDAGELTGNGGKDEWGDDAAAMARITLQRPIRMLVHADSMLPASPTSATASPAR